MCMDGVELYWRTFYVQYLLHGTRWVGSFVEEERHMIAYYNHFFVIEGKLHGIFL